MEEKFKFCRSYFLYHRNSTTAVDVGNIAIGGNAPVRVQSMTTTNTMDTEATVEQAIKIVGAGGELVRVTTQGQREAANLSNIKKMLNERGYHIPLVADVHFHPSAAEVAATLIEKVRINPGNFTGGAGKFRQLKAGGEEFQAGLYQIREKFIPFLNLCKNHETAIRIGTNHGSLSDRIMSEFGDTPRGMVESCMEYLRICRDENFHNIVLSIKSSNTRVMVHTVRLLVAQMALENMHYPMHLGVTEAGSGEDGRLKSAVGIGALLADGIGDTIRVSLTEPPENEIPVALKLIEYIGKREGHEVVREVSSVNYSPFEYKKRHTHPVMLVGGENPAVVVADVRGLRNVPGLKDNPELVLCDAGQIKHLPASFENTIKVVDYNELPENYADRVLPLFDVKDDWIPWKDSLMLKISYPDLTEEVISKLRGRNDIVLLLESQHVNTVAEQRAFFMALQNAGLTHPVIVYHSCSGNRLDEFRIEAASDTGILFLDGYGDGLCLSVSESLFGVSVSTAFGILQASRVRFSKTEFISCPGCGRTLFDLQSTTEKIRAKTAHLKGLKIAVMGCIVNGIGEMADADYGYVGAGPGKISLFRNRELVRKNIPEEEAVEELVRLIKDFGDWEDYVE